MKKFYKNSKGIVFELQGLFMKKVSVITQGINPKTYFTDKFVIFPKIRLFGSISLKRRPRKNGC